MQGNTGFSNHSDTIAQNLRYSITIFQKGLLWSQLQIRFFKILKLFTESGILRNLQEGDIIKHSSVSTILRYFDI